MLVNRKYLHAGLTKLSAKQIKTNTRKTFATAFLSLTIVAAMSSLSVQADGGMPIQDAVIFKVPENLAALSTDEISDLRQTHVENLEKTASNADQVKQAEEKLFNQLMEHDLVRLSIADVIPELISDYQIDGEFKETLLGYQSTFAVDMMRNREAVNNLADYPSYDFRFAAAYMSMLYAFQKYPGFYDRLKVDMVNEESHIGRYRKSLDESYAEVKQARAEMDFAKSGNDIKKVIAALDDELARREK